MNFLRRTFTTHNAKAQPITKFFDGAEKGIFSGRLDRYQGIRLEGRFDHSGFATKLAASEQAYREEGMRAVWLKLDKADSHLVGPAV